MSVTPDFVGQVYKDTNTGNIWRANSTTPGDWTLEVQNAKAKWTPTGSDFAESQGIYWQGDLGNSIETLSYECATSHNGISVFSMPVLKEVHAPNLVSIVYGGISIYLCDAIEVVSAPSLQEITSASLAIESCGVLISANFSSLQSVGGAIYFDANPSLVTLSLPNLVSCVETFDADLSSALQNVSLPLFLPPNTKKIDFSGCALTAVSVNHILARCVANAAYVSGIVDLSGGTNAAPTGQGITDANTLTGRGVTVSTN